MKNLHLLLALLFISFSTVGQDQKQVKNKKNVFITIDPNENGRPTQFLTTFLRNDGRLNLDRDMKAILINPTLYSDSQNSLRPAKQFGKGSTSMIKIYLDNELIFDEGINRLYILENMQTDNIAKITKHDVAYDKKIKIFRKK